jgi:hypothetical protein
VVTFVATGGNPAAAYAAFNIADTVVSGAQAIYYGADPGRVIGATLAAVCLNKFIPGGGFHSANLIAQVGVHAIRGAAIAAGTTAILGGDVGRGAKYGGIAGGTVGFVSSEQFGNFLEGDGFRSDRGVKAYKYSQEIKRMHDLNVNKANATVKVGARPLAKVGSFGSPDWANHRYINAGGSIWEMGPNEMRSIVTSNTVANISDWGTAMTTQAAIAAGLSVETTVQVSSSGLQEAIALYEQTWVGEPYSPTSHNSNFAVNSVIYGAGSNIPELDRWTPGFPSKP